MFPRRLRADIRGLRLEPETEFHPCEIKWFKLHLPALLK